MKVNVLGREYDIIERSREQDRILREKGVDGYCDKSIARVVVDNMNVREIDSLFDLEAYQKKNHEA